MSEKNYEQHDQDPQIEDLQKDQIGDQQADSVKGGAKRTVRGGDDDLEDLEVER